LEKRKYAAPGRQGGCDACSHAVLRTLSGPPLDPEDPEAQEKAQLCESCSFKWLRTQNTWSLLQLKEWRAQKPESAQYPEAPAGANPEEPHLVLHFYRYRPTALRSGSDADPLEAFQRLVGSTAWGSLCQSCARVMDPRLGERFPEIEVEPLHRYGYRLTGVDGACPAQAARVERERC